MPVIHPVFDTHIYRRIDRLTAAELKALERSQSIQALAGFYPTLELAAHLSDPADCAHNASVRGFAAIAAHTSIYNGFQPVVPFMSDVLNQLAWGLFRRKIKEERDMADFFGYALGELAQLEPLKVPDHLREHFTLMKESVRYRENKFSEDMLGMVRHIDPYSTTWQPHPNDPKARAKLLDELRDPEFLRVSAAARVVATAESCGAPLPEDVKERATEMVLAAFPTSHLFMRNLLIGMVESGTDFSRPEKANSAWDMSLAFIISPSSRVNGIPSILVTDEKRFHTAAMGTGHERFCMTYESYIALLDSKSVWEYADSLPPLVA